MVVRKSIGITKKANSQRSFLFSMRSIPFFFTSICALKDKTVTRPDK